MEFRVNVDAALYNHVDFRLDVVALTFKSEPLLKVKLISSPALTPQSLKCMKLVL